VVYCTNHDAENARRTSHSGSRQVVHSSSIEKRWTVEAPGPDWEFAMAANMLVDSLLQTGITGSAG